MSAILEVDDSFTSQPVLDNDQIGLLRDALGSDELRKMYADLPHSARNAVAEIARAISVAADLDQVRKAAHTLKGVASSFGTPRLSSVAQALELQVATIDEADSYLPILGSVLEQTLAALCEIMNDDLRLDERN